MGLDFQEESGQKEMPGAWAHQVLGELVSQLPTPALLVSVGETVHVRLANNAARALFPGVDESQLTAAFSMALDRILVQRLALAWSGSEFPASDIPVHLGFGGHSVRVSFSIVPGKNTPGNLGILLLKSLLVEDSLPGQALHIYVEMMMRLTTPGWLVGANATCIRKNARASELPTCLRRAFGLSEPDLSADGCVHCEAVAHHGIQARYEAMAQEAADKGALVEGIFELSICETWRLLCVPVYSEEVVGQPYVGVIAFKERFRESLLLTSSSGKEPSRQLEMLANVERARELEREAVAREIHDSLGQELTVVRLRLNRLSQDLRATKVLSPEQERQFAELEQQVVKMAKSARSLVREMRPDEATAHGFAQAANALMVEFRTRLGIAGQLEVSPNWTEPESGLAKNLYRSLQELLNNMAKHARATRFLIRAWQDGWKYSLEVVDDGVGIEDAFSLQNGLRSIRERAAIYGGSVTIRTRPDVEGTSVCVVLAERRESSRMSRGAERGARVDSG